MGAGEPQSLVPPVTMTSGGLGSSSMAWRALHLPVQPLPSALLHSTAQGELAALYH